MSEKKIAIMGAGIGSITLEGVNSQIKPVLYRKEPTVSDIETLAKQLAKRTVVIGPDFAKAYRKEIGDDKFYAWVTSEWIEIQCGEETYNYIQEFVKWYELKQSQKHKRRK
nr:hypothetical protein [uncultured Draconibacterium sp.]